jgi:hypothetical protein
MAELIPLFFIICYFIPFFVAATRAHHSAIPILLVNVFTAWTVVGWCAALAWAMMGPAQTAKSRARDARRYERPETDGTSVPMPRILHNFTD